MSRAAFCEGKTALLDFIVPLLVAGLVAVQPAAQRLVSQQLVLRLGATPTAVTGDVAFRPLRREVSNWRREAVAALELPPLASLQIRTGFEPREVTRCVRLNNYWCIKRAGWAGEIAADTEGHVAFAAAQEGAVIAAVLLRKYYVDYKRHSALDIVSHWAPANCGYAGGGAVRDARALAPRGLRSTLRGRWLAAHGHGSVGMRGLAHGPRLRRSAVAEHPVVMLRAPTIAVGVSEIPLGVTRFASLVIGDLPALPGKDSAAPVTSCASESQRIGNYAARAIPGIAAGINDDLMLFDADGDPTPGLALMMENMSGVEIGPLKPAPGLITAAIAAFVVQRRALLTPPASSNWHCRPPPRC